MEMSVNHTARFWDRIAHRYAAKPVADQGAYERKLAITREYLNLESNVIELGCGTGSTAIAHAPYVRHIQATDVSSRMIEIARGKAAAARIDNVDFTFSAVNDMYVLEGSFDAVLALSLLHLLEDWRDLIAAAYRMLKPDGVLVTNTMCMADDFSWLRTVAPLGRMVGLLPHLSFFSREEMERALVSTGFRIEHGWQPAPKRGVFHVARKPL